MNRTSCLRFAAVMLAVVTAVAVAGQNSPPGSLQPQEVGERPNKISAVIVLGVGTPVINAERSGTSIGIAAAGRLYVFDAGPGVERRILEARPQLASLGVRAFGPIFLTHLHIDHTLGLAALYRYHQFSPNSTLIAGVQPVTMFGPSGTRELVDHIAAGFAPWNPVGGVQIHELPAQGGSVYRDDHITVKAFPVVHKEPGPWFGYRVDVGGRTIVISGDTRPVDSVVEACAGCDILFHEVYGVAFGPEGPIGTAQGHTSAAELGALAKRANPKLLVLYHHLPVGAAEALVREIAKSFSGRIVVSKDLDVF
jgi:ribonuclease BN (tRNA processing enzyme)